MFDKLFSFGRGKSEPVQPEVSAIEEDRPKRVIREVFTEIDPSWSPLESKELIHDLTTDYPQNMSNVPHCISWALDNEPDSFFVDVQKWLPLRTVKQYIKKRCLFERKSWPVDIPEDIQNQMDKMESLRIELEGAIADRKPLKEIYEITKRYHTEAGFHSYVKISKLED